MEDKPSLKLEAVSNELKDILEKNKLNGVAVIEENGSNFTLMNIDIEKFPGMKFNEGINQYVLEIKKEDLYFDNELTKNAVHHTYKMLKGIKASCDNISKELNTFIIGIDDYMKKSEPTKK